MATHSRTGTSARLWLDSLLENPMTTKKRRLAVYAILARLLVFGLAVWLLLPETATQTGPEPAYQGKTLGQWCRQYATETMFATGPAYVAVDGMRLPVPAKS